MRPTRARARGRKIAAGREGQQAGHSSARRRHAAPNGSVARGGDNVLVVKVHHVDGGLVAFQGVHKLPIKAAGLHRGGGWGGRCVQVSFDASAEASPWSSMW